MRSKITINVATYSLLALAGAISFALPETLSLPKTDAAPIDVVITPAHVDSEASSRNSDQQQLATNPE